MFLIKSFLKGALYDCSRHSCLKLMIQAHLHAVFFSKYFLQNMFHLSTSIDIFKERNKLEVSCN